MKLRGKDKSKVVWCTWVDDECDGPWCMYGICMDRRMTSDGKCKGFKESKETLVDPEQIEDFGSEMTDNIPDKFQKDISGRRMS
ncbi:MAG: hypothetical protein ACXAAR_07510 [Candidatus Thorarchaeota archaeon]|jgi:hypothetical protein